MGRIATGVVLALIISPALAVELPDSNITPGSINPAATKEIICVRGYTSGVDKDGASVRDVSESVKKQAYRNYGLTGNRNGYCDVEGGCEVDHLISLQLGGSNDIKNLWPQPYTGQWNAHMKDGLENTLHSKVCKGEVTLHDAQRDISSNWIEAWKKYVNNKK
jgi:hypothetical protein